MSFEFSFVLGRAVQSLRWFRLDPGISRNMPDHPIRKTPSYPRGKCFGECRQLEFSMEKSQKTQRNP
jgi:hypothetical protein